jgi:mannose-6-phosphate isomerase-like protein (cupin superfamily)
MNIRQLSNCGEIIAGDGTRLRELLHPDRDYLFSGRYSLAHATIATGGKSKKHRLAGDEVYFILTGTGRMHVDNEIAEVSPGDAVNIPPGATQWIENIGDGDLVFLCMVDPAWQAGHEEILE